MKYIDGFLKAVISAAFVFGGIVLVNHGSSAAFELGCFLFGAALIHPFCWRLPNE